MKTIFKPALLALAAVFTFGSLISCDQLENPQKENEEQTEQQPEEQPEQQPEQTDTLSVDGKQWSYAFNYGGMLETTAVLDLGVTNEGIAAIYMDMGGMYFPGYAGTYTITATDGTSGTITLTDPNDPSGASVVFTYSNLTEDTVTLSCNGGEAWTTENVTANAVEMSFDEEEEEDPADEYSIDGKQWSYAFNYGGMLETTAVLDLGVTNEGIAAIYMDMGGMYFPGYAGTYTITATDGTSGTITLTDPNDPSGASVVFTYSNLTEDTVTLSCNGGEAWTTENVTAKAVEMSFDEE